MRSFFVLLAFVGLLSSICLDAMAANDSEPVNPFEQPVPGNRGVSASISDEPDAEEKRGFSLPKLALPKLPTPTLPKLRMPKVSMPSWTKKEPSPRTGPSTWQKLSTGTKSMFSKTRDTLMPWTVDDDNPPLRHATGSRVSTGVSRTRVASNRSGGSASSGEKKSIFSSFLPSSEPDETPIRTTSDFLSQKRPQFD